MFCKHFHMAQCFYKKLWLEYLSRTFASQAGKWKVYEMVRLTETRKTLFISFWDWKSIVLCFKQLVNLQYSSSYTRTGSFQLFSIIVWPTVQICICYKSSCKVFRIGNASVGLDLQYQKDLIFQCYRLWKRRTTLHATR